ncbi:MAG: Ig-like domain-containing protein [Planctomycetota bacterium]
MLTTRSCVAAFRATGLGVVAGLALLLPTGCGGGGGGGGFLPQNPTQVTINNISGDQSGSVTVNYVLTDPDQNNVDILVEFSTDGTNFQAATEDETAATSEGRFGLATSAGGTPHVFVWSSSTDAPSLNTNLAFLRIGVQENDAAPPASTDNFTLINNPNETTPPGVNSVRAWAFSNASNDVIAVKFDEEMRISSAESSSNFNLLAGMDFCGNPLDLTGASFDYDPFTNTTNITLAGNLAFGSSFTIEVLAGTEDLAGNGVPSNVSRTQTVDGDSTGPKLVDAFFIGSVADDQVPDQGEFLDLTFDEDVTLDCVLDFTDRDMYFFPNTDSVGAGATIATTADPRVLRITLGTSPTFVPGTSLINVSDPTDNTGTDPFNDSMFDLAGNRPPTPESPAVTDLLPIRADDAQAPIIDLLTLEDVPGILNGTGSAGGTLQVIQSQFTVDLEYHDVGPSLIDPDTLVIRNDRTLINSQGDDINAGTDLTSIFALQGADAEMAHFIVPHTLAFPTGTNTLTATVEDNSGNVSAQKSFTFNVVAISQGIQPFETNVNPSQVWFLDFNRDLDSLTLNYNGGLDQVSITTFRTESSPTLMPNGAPDFDEMMFIFGLLNDGTTNFQVSGTGKTNNQFMRDWMIDELLNKLPGHFPGINIQFTRTAPGGFPGGVFQVGYNSAGFSQITVSAYAGGTGALGVALVDHQNDNQDNNSLYFGSSPNPEADLGIFPGQLYDIEVNGAGASFFRQTFDPFIPGRADPLAGPTLGPVGDQSNDKAILEDIAGTGPTVTGDDLTRRDAIILALDRLANVIALVLAHETGHSMGLVANGAMPVGLYGNVVPPFLGSTSGHINLANCGAPCNEIFPGNSINIMTPAVSIVEANDPSSRFNPLILAYFRERALYN